MTREQRLLLMAENYQAWREKADEDSPEWAYLCGCFMGLCSALICEVTAMQTEIDELKLSKDQ
jgi:hypothetical protein